ncbi:hypothetical protein C8F04DRAFT_276321 [Mycena alexandri]|uniref:Uncharacterized protein n=1 Tax=Mycena alexandri TaxID=1745969 RepID=A0AAD6WRH0_9AGAR|nr:hypothetical protein C8F04DRAFT_276321 [Mycena alexandri]
MFHGLKRRPVTGVTGVVGLKFARVCQIPLSLAVASRFLPLFNAMRPFLWHGVLRFQYAGQQYFRRDHPSGAFTIPVRRFLFPWPQGVKILAEITKFINPILTGVRAVVRFQHSSEQVYYPGALLTYIRTLFASMGRRSHSRPVFNIQGTAPIVISNIHSRYKAGGARIERITAEHPHFLL